MKYSFLKEEKFDLRHQMTYIGQKPMKVFIPQSYFELKMAQIVGDCVETMAVFVFKIGDQSYSMNLPITISIKFSESEKYIGKIKPEIPEDTYRVFILEMNDAFIYDLNHKQHISDLLKVFEKLIEGGKIPPFIKYSEAISVITNIFRFSGTTLDTNSIIPELMISELYRNRRNVNEPFRLAINRNKNMTEYDGKMVRMTKVPELTSTFTGLLGEDTNHQIISSILKTRTGITEKVSPIEELIKY